MTDDGDGYGLDHLPFGIVRMPGAEPVVAVRLGDRALDLAWLREQGLLRDELPDCLRASTLQPLLRAGRDAWLAARERVAELLAETPEQVEPAWRPLAEAAVLCPVDPPDYVDFYSSIEHATNLGRMFRPDADPLLPNWRWLPVGYHGRSASVVVSGTPVVRPCGQRPGDPDPSFGPSERLDFELELGFITGDGPPLGEAIPIERAEEHVFGVVLVNDWSARDLQRWEYQPLGPFLGKSFATSISPWVVPLAALEDRRVQQPVQEPAPLPYLAPPAPGAFDIDLEVALNGTTIARTNARGLYWTMAQQLAHASVNGARVRAGDLYATGTISGSEPGTYGSLIELSWGGRDPVALDDGSRRTFLEDGDTLVLRGRAGSVSLGECAGTVVPARV